MANKRLRHIEKSNKAIKTKKARCDLLDTLPNLSSRSRERVWHYNNNIKNVFNYSTFLDSSKVELIQ